MTFMHYVILFFIYSFLGWIVEVIDILIKQKKLSNRGFLIGPYLPIYGSGCLLIIIFLKNQTSDLIGLFLKAMIICSLLEYFTSYIMEKIFKTRWWDYSDRSYNINGRICLLNMLCFGLLGCLLMYIINPILTNILLNINIKLINILGIIVIIIFVIDFIVSFKIIFNIRKVVTNVAKDSTDEITKRVKQILNNSKIYKRIIKAFPKFSISKIFKINKKY